MRGGARAAAPSPCSRSEVDIAAITQVRLPYGCPHASRWRRATSRGAWEEWGRVGAAETGVGHTVLGIFDRSRRHTDALWPRVHAVHGCPPATCGSPELWCLSKQGAVVRRTIALGATRMPSGHVCTPCTDALWPHADRPTPYVHPARSARRAMAALLATCTRAWSPHSEFCAD